MNEQSFLSAVCHVCVISHLCVQTFCVVSCYNQTIMALKENVS